jgi:hypothetical protein
MIRNLILELRIRWIAFRLSRLIDQESDVLAAKYYYRHALNEAVAKRGNR